MEQGRLHVDETVRMSNAKNEIKTRNPKPQTLKYLITNEILNIFTSNFIGMFVTIYRSFFATVYVNWNMYWNVIAKMKSKPQTTNSKPKPQILHFILALDIPVV